MTRYHGVFAPHSRWRSQITPAGRGSGKAAAETRPLAERHRAMTWVQRLKRVFRLDLETCEGCGGQVRVVACIEDPLVIAICTYLVILVTMVYGPIAAWLVELFPPQTRYLHVAAL